ncbi:helix-turn-helix domain-containing protein [Deinococcus taeanensis]|uniref:helix-turn-helix domain-containing protein n=1 Tax=Deinococcus taeanensis TaxID=2737050 RepID=UPI003D81589A
MRARGLGTSRSKRRSDAARPLASATRARIILLSAAHPALTMSEIGEKVELCDDTVSVWRRRFIQHGGQYGPAEPPNPRHAAAERET